MPRRARPLLILLVMTVAACSPADRMAAAPAAAEPPIWVGNAAAPYDSYARAANLVTVSENVRQGDEVLLSGYPRDLQLLALAVVSFVIRLISV